MEYLFSNQFRTLQKYRFNNIPAEFDTAKVIALTQVYSFVFVAEQMSSKTKYEILPRPDHMHHIVEDFLTLWDAPSSHILPLRRYLETVLDRDLRTFYASDCLEMAMLHQMVPLYCQQHYLSGRGIVKAEPLFQQS